jgi:hypothetical protein
MIGVDDMAIAYNRLSNSAESTEGGVDFNYQDRTSKKFGSIDPAWTEREIALYQWAQRLEVEAASARDSASILADAVHNRY